MPTSSTLMAENIAYWFFRLNGCLTIDNFVLHPSQARGNTLSDIDMVAVRFPHRTELENSDSGAMKDHPCTISETGLVKTGLGRLNRSWLRNESLVLIETLKRIGLFPVQAVNDIAHRLKETGEYVGQGYDVSVTVLCNKPDLSVLDSIPKLQFLTWRDEVLPFIYNRLQTYAKYKANHSQWDSAGRELYSLATSSQNTQENFTDIIVDSFNQSRRT